ncbi:MAG: glycosyltransferase [Acidiphilium sp.]|nr:glycosyltransferase [Acidiphilium sp.]MDD4936957.1 glycosyltransferase [Acidiphilium sp.]
MGSILGHVDRFEGRYVTGWAICQPDFGPCEIEILSGNGLKVGSGKAYLPRTDLAALGQGRDNFAFRVPMNELSGPTFLRVMANKVELPGSPIRYEPGCFDGAIQISAGIVDGWVSECDRSASAPLITLVGAYGKVLGTIQSQIDPAADPLFSPAYFNGDLPASCFGHAEIEIQARVGTTVFAKTRAGTRLQGYLDTLTPEHCAGWLISTDAPNRRFEIAVFRDGQEIGRGKCRIAREDLRNMFPNAIDIGFDIAFDKPHRSQTELAQISLRLAGTDVELFEGPFTAGRKPAMLAASHAAAAAILSADLSPSERAILSAAFSGHNDRLRFGPDYSRMPIIRPPAKAVRRLGILIPIYKGTAVTKACIESVLRARTPETDRLVLLNDASPEPAMADMLAAFAGLPNVVLLTNDVNQGFVRTVNRGLAFLDEGDVLLLNSDTVLYPGVLGELWRVLHSAPDIASATAISNNATIFSYPHPSLATITLDDVTWADLAAHALLENAGRYVEVPTGHGFCMLVKREVLNVMGSLDEGYGRGYGEENDLCLRAANIGYRHVAAAGALVEHVESVSFGVDKAELLRTNLMRLEGKFPEYTPLIMAFEAVDPLRTARWPLDAMRLRRAVAGGTRFALVVQTWLGGGTVKAITDIEDAVGYNGAEALTLISREDKTLELNAPGLKLRAVFLPDEVEPLFGLLEAAAVELVVVHQLLGYEAAIVRRLASFAAGRHTVAYVHDFYAACPRVTLINPIGRFCGVAEPDICGRCVALGGAHEASALDKMAPAEHRALFADFFAACGHVVVPSDDTARHLRRAFPQVQPVVMPHLHLDGPPPPPRAGSFDNIALLGAIGPHKGSAVLLEIARLARLTHPELRFHVIGYTNIDTELLKLENVYITGKYKPEALAKLLDTSQVKLALFLHGWPETFSYTLTEAAMQGLIPLVPDIGAPADRVRASGIGAVFPFPAQPAEVLAAIDTLRSATMPAVTEEGFAWLAGTTTPENVAALWEPKITVPALKNHPTTLQMSG